MTSRRRSSHAAGRPGPPARRRRPCRVRERGFTLVEILVAVVVVVLLATVALPVYQQQVREARRAEAAAMLLEAANRQARYFADTESFAADLTLLGYASDPAVSETGSYALTASLTTGGYLLTATALGSQAGDTACATLTLASDGAQGATGGGDCW